MWILPSQISRFAPEAPDSISEVKRSPLLGEHTDEVLTKVLGFNKGDVAQIKASGALTAAGKGGE